MSFFGVLRLITSNITLKYYLSGLMGFWHPLRLLTLISVLNGTPLIVSWNLKSPRVTTGSNPKALKIYHGYWISRLRKIKWGAGGTRLVGSDAQNQAFRWIFFVLHRAAFRPLSPLNSVRWFCSPFIAPGHTQSHTPTRFLQAGFPLCGSLSQPCPAGSWSWWSSLLQDWVTATLPWAVPGSHNGLHTQCGPHIQIPTQHWGLPCCVGTRLPDTIAQTWPAWFLLKIL